MNIDPLNLRNLPTARAPEELWPAVSSKLTGEDRRRQPWLLPLGLAASLILAVVCARLFEYTPENETAQATATMSDLQLTRAASAQLEQVLRQQRQGVLDTSSVATLAWMENELGWLDLQLSESPADTELWRQRVDLLGRMARTYQQNNWRAEVRLASY